MKPTMSPQIATPETLFGDRDILQLINLLVRLKIAAPEDYYEMWDYLRV